MVKFNEAMSTPLPGSDELKALIEGHPHKVECLHGKTMYIINPDPNQDKVRYACFFCLTEFKTFSAFSTHLTRGCCEFRKKKLYKSMEETYTPKCHTQSLNEIIPCMPSSLVKQVGIYSDEAAGEYKSGNIEKQKLLLQTAIESIDEYLNAKPEAKKSPALASLALQKQGIAIQKQEIACEKQEIASEKQEMANERKALDARIEAYAQLQKSGEKKALDARIAAFVQLQKQKQKKRETSETNFLLKPAPVLGSDPPCQYILDHESRDKFENEGLLLEQERLNAEDKLRTKRAHDSHSEEVETTEPTLTKHSGAKKKKKKIVPAERAPSTRNRRKKQH